MAIDALYEPCATVAPRGAVRLADGVGARAVSTADQVDQVNRVDRVDPVDQVDQVDQVDHTGLADHVSTADHIGVAGPGPADSGGPAIVIAHGFTGDLERPHVRRIAHVFAQHAAVVTFSFRGHGRSGGRCTVGDREVLDLAAAVAWARRLGHRQVITVGFSMGGSVVLRHAALYDETGTKSQRQDRQDRQDRNEQNDRNERHKRNDMSPGAAPETPESPPRPEGYAQGGGAVGGPAGGPAAGTPEPRHGGRTDARADAVVSVSAPARWYYRGTAPMRRLHWMVTRPEGRLVGRLGFRTRIHTRDWDPVPLSPLQAVALIAPTTPLLIVHGDRDPYFPLDHPQMLAEAAGGSAALWVERGMGHAESATCADLAARIAAWGVATTRGAQRTRHDRHDRHDWHAGEPHEVAQARRIQGAAPPPGEATPGGAPCRG